MAAQQHASTPTILDADTSKHAAGRRPSGKKAGANPAEAKKQGRATAKPVADWQVGELPAPSIPIEHAGQFGRIVVMDITPGEERGQYPARIELGETFTVSAQIFGEGRASTGATAVLRDAKGIERQRVPMACANPGLDRWSATLHAGDHHDTGPWQKSYGRIRRQLGIWTVTLEGWEDTYGFWLHDARIKVGVGDDVENALQSGSELLKRWAADTDGGLSAQHRRTLDKAAAGLANGSADPTTRLSAADNEAIERLHLTHPLRDGVSASQPQRFLVERPKSSFTAWYQFFPRSEGAYYDAAARRTVQGTLKTAQSGLERAAAEGFDVVYLPPIFPIGATNRKGRNNTLVAHENDPGSPFGIGSALGGHGTVDPQLGTMKDFEAFCARAHELGLEVALDFALQCSPDHPWVKEHPNWFRHKPDGTIAFAENPPKKYQDIYPIDFNADMPGIEREAKRVLNLWIDAGVTIFRIDNPHTKPVRFWQDVMAAITRKHPETLFLAEAFTRPGMMRALSYAGFTQSHCYFPWRNTKEELEEYLIATNCDNAYYQHNTFWPTTPDILTTYIRDNGIAGHAVRAVLAAMGSPSWGVYNGYELIENRQRPGSEEQLDNEKYEIKLRDWGTAGEYGIAELLTSLNAIRRRHPACRSYHSLALLESDDPNIIAFARSVPKELTGTGCADTIIVVVNLDCHDSHQTMVRLNLEQLGLPADRQFAVTDELTGREFEWGRDNYVSLAPWADVAHVLAVHS